MAIADFDNIIAYAPEEFRKAISPKSTAGRYLREGKNFDCELEELPYIENRMFQELGRIWRYVPAAASVPAGLTPVAAVFTPERVRECHAAGSYVMMDLQA